MSSPRYANANDTVRYVVESCRGCGAWYVFRGALRHCISGDGARHRCPCGTTNCTTKTREPGEGPQYE